MVDLEACKERGVKVCNVPAASNEAVAEHTIALYFALRRCVVGEFSCKHFASVIQPLIKGGGVSILPIPDEI